MTTKLDLYIKKNQKRIKGLYPSPIILRWIVSPNMRESLRIIENHVSYLIENGGFTKLDQWLLSGDIGFNTITAERYIISYLKNKNHNIVDNLQDEGIDAYFYDNGAKVGIEITTLNSFIAEWILIERLKQFLDESGFQNKDGLEITYSRDKIVSVAQGGTIYKYINKACQAIIKEDNQELIILNLSVNKLPGFPGCISFKNENNNDSSWLQDITDKLNSKLHEPKKVKQLKENARNVVFVGLNHDSQSNGVFPRIFDVIGKNEERFKPEILSIREYWKSYMEKLTNVNGICYFFYSLDREEPFYPLTILWRSGEDKLAIKL